MKKKKHFWLTLKRQNKTPVSVKMFSKMTDGKEWLHICFHTYLSHTYKKYSQIKMHVIHIHSSWSHKWNIKTPGENKHDWSNLISWPRLIWHPVRDKRIVRNCSAIVISSHEACNRPVHFKANKITFSRHFSHSSWQCLTLKSNQWRFCTHLLITEGNKLNNLSSAKLVSECIDISHTVLAAIIWQMNCHFKQVNYSKSGLFFTWFQTSVCPPHPLWLSDSMVIMPLQWQIGFTPNVQQLCNNRCRLPGLIHTKVGKLHLVDGYRSTLALTVTWRNGSRWAGRGSECGNKQQLSLSWVKTIIIVIIYLVSITAIDVITALWKKS